MAETDETRLSREERALVSKLIEGSGLVVVAKQLRVAPQTLRAVAGGLKGHRGTIALVRQGLDQTTFRLNKETGQ